MHITLRVPSPSEPLVPTNCPQSAAVTLCGVTAHVQFSSHARQCELVFSCPPSRPAVLHCGAPSFPMELSQRTALGILTPVAQEHRLHKVLVPVSLGSLPAGYTAPARRAPGGPRSLGDRGRLALISTPRLPTKCAGSLASWCGHAVGGRGAAAPGDARVCAPTGRLAGGAQLS